MSNLAIVLAVFIFIIGTILGSFANVLIFRFREKKWWQMILGRSKCDVCKHVLDWHDLIPIFSFFWLKRTCRICKAQISWQYPIVELVAGILAVGLFFQLGLSWALLLYGLISVFLVALFVIDLRHGLLPDILLIPVMVLTLLVLLLSAFAPDAFSQSLIDERIFSQTFPALFATQNLIGPTAQQWANSLIYNFGGGAFVLAFFGIQFLISPKWIGLGDLKLGTLLGLLVGWPLAALWLFLAYLAGGVVSVVLLVSRHKKIYESIPFGPFLIFAFLLTFFWGAQIWNWFFGMF